MRNSEVAHHWNNVIIFILLRANVARGPALSTGDESPHFSFFGAAVIDFSAPPVLVLIIDLFEVSTNTVTVESID
jgi:hypothetical protein